MAGTHHPITRSCPDFAHKRFAPLWRFGTPHFFDKEIVEAFRRVLCVADESPPVSTSNTPSIKVASWNIPIPPPPCLRYTNVRNYYRPYAHCNLDKGVACAQHIQLQTHTCGRKV